MLSSRLLLVFHHLQDIPLEAGSLALSITLLNQTVVIPVPPG